MGYRAKLVIAIFVPVLFMAAVMVNNVSKSLNAVDILRYMDKNLSFMVEVSHAITELQRERGLSVLSLKDSSVKGRLASQRTSTDEKLDIFFNSAKEVSIGDKKNNALKQLSQSFDEARRAYNMGDILKVQEYYTRAISYGIELVSMITNSKTSRGFGKRMVGLLVLEEAKENMGQFRALLGKAVADPEGINVQSLVSLSEGFNLALSGFSNPALILYPENRNTLEELIRGQVLQQIQKIYEQSFEKQPVFSKSGLEVFNLCTRFIDSIGTIILSENSLLQKKIEGEQHVVYQEVQKEILLFLAVLILAALLGYFVYWDIKSRILSFRGCAEKVTVGDLSQHFDEKGNDDISNMATSFNRMIRSLQEKAETATVLADGDMTCQVKILSEKDQFGQAFSGMIAALKSIVMKVSQIGFRLSDGASQVSDASQSLSQGATESAASLEQITSTMTEISSQAHNNAENAAQANTLSDTAFSAVETGVSRMNEMEQAMAEIHSSSGNITKIIKTIDEIAFQTNLLSLNAAVEAARAGRHGKGFAVVADEVRSLASRSAQAAKETEALIEESNRKVEEGGNIAKRTAGAFKEIMEQVEKVASLTGEIAQASKEQAEGATQISEGLNQIDSVTQQNTANAEQTAAAAAELLSLAEDLQNTLQYFTLPRQNQRSYASQAAVSQSSSPALSYEGGWGEESTEEEPVLIRWKPEYSVNVPKMDEQHKRLVGLINRLYAGLKTGKANEVLAGILEELVDYTKTHFAAEESFLQMHRYEGLEEQRRLHARLIEQVEDIRDRYAQGYSLGTETINFLKNDWLMKHILHVDTRYQKLGN
jgi:methyl-accepting chemotaxis protein